MKIKTDKAEVNSFSRCGKPLISTKKIVLHYVNNPGTTAQQNVDYIKGLKNQKDSDNLQDTYASAHYFVDRDNIINVIPEGEMAYHVGALNYTEYGLSISAYPNARTIGVEFSHPNDDGRPDRKTYARLLWLLARLCMKYDLDPIKDICRHYDITGKLCPKYYVENESLFEKLKKDVKNYA